MERDPNSMLFELEYVKLMLDDLNAINAQINAMVDPIGWIPVLLLPLAINPKANVDEISKEVCDHVNKSLEAIQETQVVLQRLIDLVSGRSKAIGAELHGDE